MQQPEAATEPDLRGELLEAARMFARAAISAAARGLPEREVLGCVMQAMSEEQAAAVAAAKEAERQA